MQLILNNGNLDFDSHFDKLNIFQKTILNSLKQRLLCQYNDALIILTNSLEENEFKELEEASVYLERGKCLKLLNKLEESLLSFLKSAKLNQYSADVFYHIAECYTSMK